MNRMCDDYADRDRNDGGPNGPLKSSRAREDWIQLYTRRILRAWFHQEAPLGLALTYAHWIRQDLAKRYRHPLTRAFIEETYRVQMD